LAIRLKLIAKLATVIKLITKLAAIIALIAKMAAIIALIAKLAFKFIVDLMTKYPIYKLFLFIKILILIGRFFN